MAYHAREHGSAGGATSYVLVQGRAEVIAEPSAEQHDEVREHATEHLGKPASGLFWDRWLREYYRVRVPVRIVVERMVVWPDLRCAGEPRVIGAAPPAESFAPQRPPKGGVEPRIDMTKAGRRLAGVDHLLLGFGGADGFPQVLPVRIEAFDAAGIRLGCDVALPSGGRRAGLLGHSYRPKLIGLEARQHTGWLDVGADGTAWYAPHTQTGYVAPPNKTLLLLLNGALAKKGLRATRKAAAA